MAVTSSYTVRGMTCEHCVRSVSGELLKVAGVHEVVVDLETGSVDVTSAAPLALDEVRHAVDEAGYMLAGAAS
jgi:copper chaperone CopZ